MKKVLFLGNGINRINNNISWENLINNLFKFTRKLNDNLNHIPFPMLYEYLYLTKDERITENDLIKQVIAEIKKIKPNSMYRVLAESKKYTDIITTNYDKLIEKNLNARFSKKEFNDYNESQERNKPLNKKRERRYRIYTKEELLEININVWHIHGQVDYPKTIVLGYEYYLSVVGKIKEHLDNTYKKKTNNKESWIDLLLFESVDIIGYGLEYFESTVWYVLNYRAREISENNLKKNEISYHILKKDKDIDVQKKKLLEAYYINVIVHDFEDYEQMYIKIFNQ